MTPDYVLTREKNLSERRDSRDCDSSERGPYQPTITEREREDKEVIPKARCQRVCPRKKPQEEEEDSP